MKAHQTPDGFFRADAVGAPKRRTKKEAEADADMIDPKRELDRSDKIVLRAVLVLATIVVWFVALGMLGL